MQPPNSVYALIISIDTPGVVPVARQRIGPQLWRIHIRTINGLLVSIDSTTRTVDKAAATLRWAGVLFLAGLLAVAVALGTLIVEVTF